MMRRVLASFGVAALAIVLWILNCTGPKPVVESARVVPPAADGQPYRVEATIRNTWRGQGEVTVNVQLRDRATGHTVQQHEQVMLDPWATVIVVSEIQAPKAEYVPLVSAEYPQR